MSIIKVCNLYQHQILRSGFYGDFNVCGTFVTTALTTHYLGLVFQPYLQLVLNLLFIYTSTNYMILNYTEIQLNVLT